MEKHYKRGGHAVAPLLYQLITPSPSTRAE